MKFFSGTFSGFGRYTGKDIEAVCHVRTVKSDRPFPFVNRLRYPCYRGSTSANLLCRSVELEVLREVPTCWRDAPKMTRMYPFHLPAVPRRSIVWARSAIHHGRGATPRPRDRESRARLWCACDPRPASTSWSMRTSSASPLILVFLSG